MENQQEIADNRHLGHSSHGSSHSHGHKHNAKQKDISHDIDSLEQSEKTQIEENNDTDTESSSIEEDEHNGDEHIDFEIVPDHPHKPWYRGANDVKLLVMMILTCLFMVVEMVIGFKSGSLALVGDAFHMASDGIALIIAFAAIQMGKKSSTTEHTYGWQRSEVIGSFINGVFLLSVCLFISLEAIQRFVNLEQVTDPLMVVYTGCGGLALNIIGLLIFAGSGGHGHSHDGGGHGHHDGGHGSHGAKKKGHHSHGHSHSEGQEKEKSNKKGRHSHGHSHSEGNEKDKSNNKGQHSHGHSHSEGNEKDKSNKKGQHSSHSHSHSHSEGQEKSKRSSFEKSETHSHSHGHKSVPTQAGLLRDEDSESSPVVLKAHRDDNIYAVFIHVLGDFLGSLAAIASGLLINFLDFPEKYYFDPALSLVIVLLILKSSLPLVQRCIHVFMQKVPTFLDVAKLKTDLDKVPGVISVHELHVWTLVGNKTIGSVHITCLDRTNFMEIAKKMKKIFHKHNVHSSTIQPEFLGAHALKKKRERCQLGCLKEETCKTESCCPATYDDALGDDELQSLLQFTQTNKKARNPLQDIDIV